MEHLEAPFFVREFLVLEPHRAKLFTCEISGGACTSFQRPARHPALPPLVRLIYQSGEMRFRQNLTNQEKGDAHGGGIR
jgi:hypothetical protein